MQSQEVGMKTLEEIYKAGAAILHGIGNSLNTVLHGCYEDAGVTDKQKKAAVDDLIKAFEELRELFNDLKEIMKGTK